MRTALLLSMQHLGKWSENAAAVRLPGGTLPYGLQYLRRDFELTWSDGQRNGIYRSRIFRALGGAARRGAPGLQGSLAGVYALAHSRSADVALSVFENVGLGFARLQRLAPAARLDIPHIMLTCWLAEDCLNMSSAQLRSIRRSTRSISKIAVFSANQVPILEEFLKMQPERIAVVPFGVDVRYYDASDVDGSDAGGGLVAIGGDSRRDYATLAEAVRLADIPLTLVCYPRNIAGIDLPPHIKVLSGVYLDNYRKLLLAADLIVTPTTAPAYPSGQSVVLEAMSMGRATLTTDSPAMRDYVTDGVDGVLVPARDPAAMAQHIVDLMSDAERRKSLGAAAAQTVRKCFDLEHMWRSVSSLMTTINER